MARTRSIRIRESLEELEQLRQFHRGTPQERRILFLSFLKEETGRTIAEAARKADISDRRGRRWWDSYRDGGLTKLLELRIWKREELEPTPLDVLAPGAPSSHSQISPPDQFGIDFPAFLVAVSGLATYREPTAWAQRLREILVGTLPEIDYAVVSVRSNVNLTSAARNMVFREQVSPEGEVAHEVQSVKEKNQKYLYEDMIEQGKRRKFPFEKYHYPPPGYAFFVRPPNSAGNGGGEGDTVHVGSLLIFRAKSEPEFTQELLDLIERLRPFITFLFTDFIVRVRYEKPGSELLVEAVGRVAGDVGLSPRESDVLLLEMLGHSYEEIGKLLSISPKTVQSHVRSVYQKSGVSRLSEFFARYFTPRSLFPEREAARET